MKGKIQMTDKGWVVSFLKEGSMHFEKGHPVGLTFETIELPVYPDHQLPFGNIWHGKEVEFTIVNYPEIGECCSIIETERLHTIMEQAQEAIRRLSQCEVPTITSFCSPPLIPADYLTHGICIPDEIADAAVSESLKNLPDDGLFPNYTDKDIYASGMRNGINWAVEYLKGKK